MANGLRPFALPRPNRLRTLPDSPVVPAHNTRRYEHPLAGGPGPIGVGRSPIHPTSWKNNCEKVCLDGRGVHDFLCYCGEACCSSCCSSITFPKVSSISNEKRTMPLSLPLSSKYRASSS